MDILRSLDKKISNKLIASYGDIAPQCYFCGHWDIEETSDHREVCRKCGAEIKYGFGIGRWVGREEEQLNEIKDSGFILGGSQEEAFVYFGNEMIKSVKRFLKKYPLPCPHCEKTTSLKQEENRWICEDCGLKGPNKSSKNPTVAWNKRRGRRTEGDGTSF